MEFNDHQTRIPDSSDAIDFGKLGAIIRRNWIWITMIFLVINAAAYIIIRYSKNVYQSTSEIKLDIKSEASDLGIKTFGNDESVNLISGEIEIIQSKLFLNRVIEGDEFRISFISLGHLLDEELYKNPPVFVKVNDPQHSYYNIPLYFFDNSKTEYTIRVGENGPEYTGSYGQPLKIQDLSISLTRNENFTKGDEVGYYFLINSSEALLSYVSKNLLVEPLNFNAKIIGVSFKDHNALKAHDILAKINNLYLQYSNEQKNLTNKQKIDWLTSELNRIEARMEDYENYFKEFTLENKTNNLDQNLQRTIEAINVVDSQRYDLSRSINEIERLYTNLLESKFQVSPNLRSTLPATLASNIDDILKLALDIEKMKLSYQETTFAYREKQNQLDILRTKSSEQLLELKNEWSRQLQDLNRKKVRLENEFKSYPDKNTAFTKNQRFYKLYEEFYLSLMQSKSEFEIAQAGTSANFQILSPASVPSRPIAPNRPIIMGIGFVLSLGINFFFLGILYLLNNKVTTISELEQIRNAPVIGVVPNSKFSHYGLHILDYPKSMVSEAMRTVRTNLDFFNIASGHKVMAVSSTISGEGKSFVALNLGGILALTRKRVVLVDLDMRKAKTSQPAEIVDNTKGVSTILIRKHTWEECIVKTAIDTFDYIPSGPHPPNPSELLLNGDFTEMIDGLKKVYDIVILDTPPVGLVTDGIMAMRKADISIYIFRANYSKKEYLSNLQRLITLNKFTNITTLLNAVPRTGRPYGYGYYDDTQKPSKRRALQDA